MTVAESVTVSLVLRCRFRIGKRRDRVRTGGTSPRQLYRGSSRAGRTLWRIWATRTGPARSMSSFPPTAFGRQYDVCQSLTEESHGSSELTGRRHSRSSHGGDGWLRSGHLRALKSSMCPTRQAKSAFLPARRRGEPTPTPDQTAWRGDSLRLVARRADLYYMLRRVTRRLALRSSGRSRWTEMEESGLRL